MYCRECYETMLSYGELPTLHYQVICEEFARSGHPVTFPSSCDRWTRSAIKFLEAKEYIVTTDCKEGVKAKPLGHKQIAINKHSFCAAKGEHD